MVAMIFLVCFFLSGLSGLVYEIVWVRMIDKVVGSAPFAVAIVLTVFMGGLALGSFLAGRRIDRISEKRGLLAAYGKLELGIGAYSLLLPLLVLLARPLYAVSYNYLFDDFWLYSLFTFFGCGVLLVLPTTLMGATLPVLCRFYVERLDQLGTRTGRLYGLNTLGACVGALVCGFFLVRALGVFQTLLVAAGINFAIGGLCTVLAKRIRPDAGTQPARTKSKKGLAPQDQGILPDGETVSGSTSIFRFSLLIYAVSGFCAMAYQVIWSGLLGLLMGPTAYAFTLVVATFILGLALGSLIFGYLADRVRRVFPLLVWTQIGAAILALLVSHLLGNSQLFFAKLIYTLKGAFDTLMLGQSVLLFGFLLGPTLLLGASFPLVTKIYARSLNRVGRSIGTAYALNTVGAILGSFVAGFVLIPFLGKAEGLRWVCGLQLTVALAGLLFVARHHLPATPDRERAGSKGLLRWVFVGLLFVMAGLSLYRFPDWSPQLLSYGRYHYFGDMVGDLLTTGWVRALWQGKAILSRHEAGREVVFYGDGLAGFTTVEKAIDSLGTVKFTLLNSGKPDASSHGDRSTQTLLAHVPLLFHPHPEKVMVLGLASGMTAGEVLHYPVKQLDILEINPEVVKACAFFTQWNNGCLTDPRSRIIVQDGRNHLALTRERYDVIISEPSNPWMAGLANLYTRECFLDARSRLRDGGIFVQWIHSYEMNWSTFAMAGRTFCDVFPQSLMMRTLTGLGDYLLIGFKGQARLDLETARRNLVFAKKSTNMTLPDPALLYDLIVSADLKALFGDGPLHTDDKPLLEFAAPRQLFISDIGVEKQIARRARLPEDIRRVVEANKAAGARLDMVAFAASAFAPSFQLVEPYELDPPQRDRYLEIVDAYCRDVPVGDYGVLPEKSLRTRCAGFQLERIRKHLSTHPTDGPAYHSMALALKQVGKRQEAIEAFLKAVSLNPYDFHAYNNLGITYLEDGDLKASESAFRSAIQDNPAYAKAYFNLAEIRARQGLREKAASLLRQGLRYEDNPMAHQFLRELLFSP
jgi:spermidine synthase